MSGSPLVDRLRDLLAAEPSLAEMGPGRVMGPGWIAVAADAITDDDQLGFWLTNALECNREVAAGRG